MQAKAWPNNLGHDVTVKGKTWECSQDTRGRWTANLRIDGVVVRQGFGTSWLHAIAFAMPTKID